MCTVNDEYDEAREFIPEDKFQILDGALCQKCNVENALIVLRGKDVYCKACFLIGATHKFRATLGKSKVVRPKDKILVAHSGKAGSVALLHLIKAGMHESVHKRLVFETKVLFIDDGATEGQNPEGRIRRIEAIKNQTSSLGFETFALSFSQSLSEQAIQIQSLDTLSSSLTAHSSFDERLKNVLSRMSDRTSELELIRKLRRKLIYAASRKLGCNKIFLADDSTSLAIDILSNVALGRGSQLSMDVGFVDDRFPDIILLRPMRDFTRHELSLYLNFHDLKSVKIEDSSFVPGSIHGITGKFVEELDSRFNGTVSTIFRTGEKISCLPCKNHNNDENCAFCDAPLDTSSSETVISAIQATAFSRLVSSEGPNGDIKVKIDEAENPSSGCGNCNGRCAKSQDIVLTMKTLTRFLCYACRLIFRNSEIQDVPACVVDAVKQKLSLVTMREEITDFLL